MSHLSPLGELSTFEVGFFEQGGASHRVYRKGSGPAVVVITEMPGITPMVLGFADRVVNLGCSVVLPDLFGTPGRDPSMGYIAKSIASGCISKDFSTLALGKTSPIADWLRALARAEHERCGGPGVGTVGMCFSGGFALAMATDPAVVAPVLSQPGLPFPVSKKHRGSIDVSPEDLDLISHRCAAEGLSVLGLRFDGDLGVPADRFAFLSQRLGECFTAVELDQADGNPVALESPEVVKHHSVLTASLIDEPGEPTRKALDQVLDLFRLRLLES